MIQTSPELTEQWSDDDMRTNIDIETQYRAACEAADGAPRTVSDVQHRCLTDNAELRAEGGDSRAVITGIARALRRRGAHAGIPGAHRQGRVRRCRPRAMNLTLQHERALPVGHLWKWQDR